MVKMTDAERVTLERLIAHAIRDSGQSRRVADFLLAWWSLGQCGGFNITVTWRLDDETVGDVAIMFSYAARNNHYPDTLGYGSQSEAIAKRWRPELISEEGQ